MNKGTLAAFFSYVLWGFFPLYFHLFNGVPAIQTTAHRVVWSFLFLVIIVSIRGEIRSFIAGINRKVFVIYLIAGSLLAINWLTYVWAVGQERVLETSLGYFINPLVSVMLGVVILKERLRRLQWLPIIIAAGAVLYLTISLGSLPWISLTLAFSFGLYALVKKLAPLGSLHGLVLETTAIFLPALAYLLVMEFMKVGSFGHGTAVNSILLALTGVVTVAPLLLFSIGAKKVPLVILGLLQYIAPTIQFFIGILIFKEPMITSRLIGFIIIWIALIIFTVENLLHRKSEAAAAS